MEDEPKRQYLVDSLKHSGGADKFYGDDGRDALYARDDDGDDHLDGGTVKDTEKSDKGDNVVNFP
jgi:hypothetical protein